MRTTLTRNLVFAFVGAVGLVGSASARPERDHTATPTVREGTPPEHVFRADVQLRAAHDGRGDTNPGDRGSAKRDNAFTTPSAGQVDNRLDAPRGMPLPFGADIRNRVQMRTDGDDPKSLDLRSRDSRSHAGASGASTLTAPSNVAPIAIKSDILLKIEAGEDSQINPVARPDDKRATRVSKGDWMSVMRSKIGDASQADLRDSRTYPGRNENVPTPAQMFSKQALSNGSGSSGDASSEPTP